MTKKLKIIVAGSRECSDYDLVNEAIQKGLDDFGITIKDVKEIVSGGARGVDLTAENWAKRNNINCVRFPADWSDIKDENAIVKYRKNPYTKKDEAYNANAGFKRNKQMAEYADALIAIDFDTNGTNNMISLAKKQGLKVYCYQPEELQEDDIDIEF